MNEVNLDGLVGPTHHYAGLSHGNLASIRHGNTPSNPREAALQGLQKMKFLHDLGMPQAVLPPQERPHLEALRAIGFAGSDDQVIDHAFKECPEVLAACSSASSMWVANSATFAPSVDTGDRRAHFTPANLVSKFHRSLESSSTASILRRVFSDPASFSHHPPLIGGAFFGDEGAANHSRLCADYGSAGVHLFVYGRSAFKRTDEPKRFPARQTYEASRAIARLHQLSPERVVFAQQNPAAIDAGAFHNDVVAVGNRDLLLVHELAFSPGTQALGELRDKFQRVCGKPLRVIEVKDSELPMDDVVKSYLFNSQLLTTPAGETVILAPNECREIAGANRYLNQLREMGAISQAHFFDLRQSMKNGGGPACLRLRLVLSAEQRRSITPRVFIDDRLYEQLVTWVRKHYRDRLAFEDLRDPSLYRESCEALEELTSLLKLGSLYAFQTGS